jgi:hypothetical protein
MLEAAPNNDPVTISVNSPDRRGSQVAPESVRVLSRRQSLLSELGRPVVVEDDGVLSALSPLPLQRTKEWKTSCFGNLDRSCCLFFAQLGICLITLLFCLWQLAIIEDGGLSNTYVGMVTFILGIYCPNPRLYKN